MTFVELLKARRVVKLFLSSVELFRDSSRIKK